MLRSSPLTQLLHKPMDRKTFLKTLAIGVALAGGAAGLMRLLGHRATTNDPTQTYGSSTYGGSPKN